jgi:hypothetical protein
MDIKENQQTNSEQNQQIEEEVESVNKHKEEKPEHTENEQSKESAEQQKDNDQFDYSGNDSNPDLEAEEVTDRLESEENEDEEEDERPSVDYTNFTKEQLVERLRDLIQNENIPGVKKEVEIIKANFYKKHRAETEEEKKRFINEGGNPEEFTPSKDAAETELKELLKEYKEKKANYNKQIDDQKQENLRKKYEVIEELKNLINKKESLGQTFREFRDLQRRWKEIGPIPQNKVKDLWGTYHHHVEKFYDYVKINKELRDLDLKKNLEAKLDLCRKAEELTEEDDIVHAFKTLQTYHDKWREIGPVPNEKKEEIWQRFKEATTKINKRHQQYFKELRQKQNENLKAKQELCEKAEEIAEMQIDSHKDWNHYTQQILDLQKQWRTIGFAPRKHNNKIYRRFRKACDKFFAQKRVFYTQHKEWQENNLKKKQEFAARAEELKDSEDWDNTAKELIRLQKEWKEIGPVPKKYSEEVWNRFRSACDEFFQRRKKKDKNKDNDFENNLKAKQDLIERIKNFQPGDNTEETLNQLNEFEKEWANIGFVPFKYKDQVQQEYREAMYDQYNKLDISELQRELLKYRSKIKNIQQKPKAESRMRQEREKFMNKISKLETNISTWENNLGFISAESNEANSMIQDFKEKIKNAREEIELLEEKVKLIDKLEDEEE